VNCDSIYFLTNIKMTICEQLTCWVIFYDHVLVDELALLVVCHHDATCLSSGLVVDHHAAVQLVVNVIDQCAVDRYVLVGVS
jgi:hypothetical protein